MLDQEVPGNYTVTVAGDYPYVNNQNEKDVNIQISLKEELSKEETFTLELKGTKKDDNSEVTASRTIKIPANTSKITVAGTAVTANESTGVDEVKQWTTGGAVDLKTSTEWSNGLIKGTLKNSKGTIVSEFTIEKYSTTPRAKNIVTERKSTYEYNFSLETLSEYPLAKVFYYRIQYSSSSSQGNKTAPVNKESTMFSNGTLLTCTDGKLNKLINDKTMTEGYASTLYFVLEDIYGNRTVNPSDDGKSVFSTIITTDKGVTDGAKVSSVTAPSVTDAKEDANFKWTTPNDTATYTVRIYYKETADSAPIILNEETGVKGTGSGTYEAKTSVFGDLVTKPGFYYAEVITEATAVKKASEPVKSTEIQVKQMPAVKNLEYTESDSSSKLTWDNSAYSENTANFEKVTFTIKRADGNTIGSESAAIVSDIAKKETTLSNLKNGVIYIATATVEAKLKDGSKATLEYLNSEPVESKAFFKLGDTAVETVGNTTVTLKNVPDVKVNNKSAKYNVKAVEILDGDSGVPVEGKTTTIPNLQADENQHLVINGLETNKKYRLKLECTTADGITASSSWIPTGTSVIRTLPEIVNLTFAKTETEATNGIWANNSKLVIKGQPYTSSDFGATSSQFTNILNIVKGLKAGDTITLNPDDMIADIIFENSTEGDNTRNFSSYLKDYNVTLTSGSTRRSISISSAKDLVLKSGLFSLTSVSGLESKYITCNNGVDIANSSSKKIKVLATAEVTIDGFVVKPSLDTTMEYKNSKLNIDMTSSENIINIANNKKSALTVNFISETKPETTQYGTITITNNGNITVTAEANSNDAGNVNSTMNITVTDGNVDVSKKNVTGGEKTITVHNTNTSSGHTVKGYAKNKLPNELVSTFTEAKTINLSKSFNVNDDKTWDPITTVTSLNKTSDAEKIKLLINYLNDNFGGLIGKDVTISIDQSTPNVYNGYALITLTIKEATNGNPLVITGLE